MPVLYDSKKIIPVPTVSISKDYKRTGDGTVIGQTHTIVMNGTIVAYKGSPDSSGIFWTTTGYPPDETIGNDSRLASILDKQEALRCLFSHEGRTFEIDPWDGTAPTKCNPRILKLDFQPGNWYEKCDYSVTMEADHIYNNLSSCPEDFAAHIDDASEEWQIEESDHPFSYRLTHNLHAKGKNFYDINGVVSSGWIEARNWVLPKLGLDAARITSSGVLNLPSYYGGYNYVRSENINKYDGTYGVIETWLVASGNALEDFTVDTKVNGEDGRTTVGIQGTVTGLQSRNNTTWNTLTEEKYHAASGYYGYSVEPNLFSRATNYGGTQLNPLPLNKTVGRNPITGVITYNYEYDNRPAPLIDGALSQSIVVTDINQNDVFAVIPVLGRLTGPVLQYLGSRTEKKRNLSIELVGPAVTYGSGFATKPNVSTLISLYIPTSYSYIRLQGQDEESFDVIKNRYTRNLSWTYE